MTREKTLKGFGTVGLLLGMIMVGANIPAPLYGVYAARFHFGPAMLTIIFATYMIFLIPSFLYWGQRSDYSGRRTAIGGGLFLAVLGALAFLVNQGMWTLVVARALQGLATGMVSGPATAMLAELDPSRRKAPLVTGLATTGGTAAGPLFGGIMAQVAPWPLHLAYGIALLGLLGIGLAFRSVADTRQRQSTPFRWRRSRIPVEIREVFWLASMTAVVVWSVTAFFMSLAPSYVQTLLHITNLAVTGGVVFLMLSSAFVTQLLTRSFRPGNLMPIGLGLTLTALLGWLLAVSHDDTILLIASTMLAGIGQGMAYLGSLTTITQATPVARKADVVSNFFVVIYIGMGVPVIGLGLVAQQFGLYHAMMSYTVFIGISVLGLVSGLLRHRVRRDPTLQAEVQKGSTQP